MICYGTLIIIWTLEKMEEEEVEEEEPFLWLGCCLLIFHVKDVKVISQLVVEERSWRFLNQTGNVFPLHSLILIIIINIKDPLG